MYKVGAVGDFENTAYFGAIGAETFFPKSEDDAEKIIKKMCSGDFAVMYVSEKYYAAADRAAQSVKDKLTPVIVPLPLGDSINTGRNVMSGFVKQAVGSDIIFEH